MEKLSVKSNQYFFRLLLVSVLFLNACGGSPGEGDLSSPEISLSAVNPSVYEKEKSISGIVDLGADVDVSVDTEAIIGDVLVESGVWSCTISDLEPGANNITVVATDEVGNSSSLVFSLVYDIVRVDQASTSTSETAPTVYGSIIPGGSITSVMLNDVIVDAPIVYDGYTWAFSLPFYSPLVSGNNTLTITAQDVPIDPQYQEISLSITQDEFITPLTINRPTSPQSNSTITLTGSMVQGAEIDVEVSSAATIDFIDYPTQTSWSTQLSNLSERDNLITVSSQYPGLGTASSWTRVEVYTHPQVIVTLPLAGATDVLANSVIIAVFSEAVVSTSINENSFWVVDEFGTLVDGMYSYDAVSKSATFAPNIPLISGRHYTANISSAVVDPEGNSVTPYAWSFSVF